MREGFGPGDLCAGSRLERSLRACRDRLPPGRRVAPLTVETDRWIAASRACAARVRRQLWIVVEREKRAGPPWVSARTTGGPRLAGR